MRNSVSDVTDAEILDETREAMTQAAFDAADEANAAQAVESATESLPAFDELGLSDEMLRAIENLGYTAPTPVQAGSIPVVLEGRDLLAAAQTGTGKTAAFLLPTMNNLEHIAPPKPVRERGGRNRRRGAKKPEGNGRGPVMLVITPTRELAQQIDEVASKIADVTGHVAVTVVGGVSYKPQTAALKYGCDILVATPGRLVDLIEQGACHLGEVKVLVLDEADRMLDMGFLPAVRRIVRETPAERQTLLFSATLDEEAVGEITDLVSDPARVEIPPRRPPTPSTSLCSRCLSRPRTTCCPSSSRRRVRSALSSLCAPSTAPTAAAVVWSARASGPPRFTATAARPSASARFLPSATAPSTCWWQPTCSPAASILATCATS